VPSNTLSFAISGFVDAAMDLDIRIFVEKPVSRSIYFPILILI
jgi:hypothetical protein